MKLFALALGTIALFTSSQAFALGNGCYKFDVKMYRNLGEGRPITYFLWIGNGTYKVEAGNIASLSLVSDGLCGSKAGSYATTSYEAYCRHLQRLGQKCDLQ